MPIIESALPAEFPVFAARIIADLLRRDLADRSGRVIMALSGGSTPAVVYEALAKEQLAWDRVHLVLGDERLVPSTDIQSNYRMACEKLLHGPAAAATLHGVFVSDDATGSARQYEALLRALTTTSVGIPKLPLVLLGLGEDGHTASLFPGAQSLNERAASVAVAQHPQTGQSRITFTIPVIEAAQDVVFLVTGAAKRSMLAKVLATGAVSEYPARVWHGCRGQVRFLVDTNAYGGV